MNFGTMADHASAPNVPARTGGTQPDTPIGCSYDVVENAQLQQGVTLHSSRFQQPRRVLLCGWLSEREYAEWVTDPNRALPHIHPSVAHSRWLHAYADAATGDRSVVDDSQRPHYSYFVVEVAVRVHRRSRSA